jgi:hypothetical protein
VLSFSAPINNSISQQTQSSCAQVHSSSGPVLSLCTPVHSCSTPVHSCSSTWMEGLNVSPGRRTVG